LGGFEACQTGYPFAIQGYPLGGIYPFLMCYDARRCTLLNMTRFDRKSTLGNEFRSTYERETGEPPELKVAGSTPAGHSCCGRPCWLSVATKHPPPDRGSIPRQMVQIGSVPLSSDARLSSARRTMRSVEARSFQLLTPPMLSARHVRVVAADRGTLSGCR
jgi:hypothetical protein